MDVQLWFARNEKKEIVSIMETISGEKYCCPLCSSEVIPKAKQSTKVTPHFAHIDRNECKGESVVHWWFKHSFLETGETFTIKTDKEYTFVCKSIMTEKTFKLKAGIYRPDLIITTECGQEVIFEMANSNKKKVKDYIDKWIELNRIVVEVDIKSLINIKEAREFKALYYKGKCFNINTRDGGYYKTIGRYKEELLQKDKYDADFVKELDWFWNTIQEYKYEMISDDELVLSIDSLSLESLLKAEKIIGRQKCVNIVRPYFTRKTNVLYDKAYKVLVDNNLSCLIDLERDYGIDYYGFRRSWYGIKAKRKKDSHSDFISMKNITQFYQFVKESRKELQNDYRK